MKPLNRLMIATALACALAAGAASAEGFRDRMKNRQEVGDPGVVISNGNRQRGFGAASMEQWRQMTPEQREQWKSDHPDAVKKFKEHRSRTQGLSPAERRDFRGMRGSRARDESNQ